MTESIDRATRAEIETAVAGGPEAIERRLTKLDYEWDVDRALMVNFAIVGAASLTTGLLRYKLTPTLHPKREGFLYFFGAQLGFLLLHGTMGWCPPASVFRRLGFRTQREIEAERNQLRKALTALTESK
ncbi:MAG: DUF2892 domain-containing protein [Polyangiaceae bacterium]